MIMTVVICMAALSGTAQQTAPQAQLTHFDQVHITFDSFF
jgi:hypothetical protein